MFKQLLLLFKGNFLNLLNYYFDLIPHYSIADLSPDFPHYTK